MLGVDGKGFAVSLRGWVSQGMCGTSGTLRH